MSADNMIAIFDDGSGVHRVQHMVSFYPEYMTRDEFAQAFERATAFEDPQEADAHARDLYRAEDICEYGIVGFTLDDAGYRSWEDLPAVERAQREIMDQSGSMTQAQLRERSAQILRDDLQGGRVADAVQALAQVDDRIVGELASQLPLNDWQWDNQPRQILLDAHVVRTARNGFSVHLTAVGAAALAELGRLDGDAAQAALEGVDAEHRLDLIALADESDDRAAYMPHGLTRAEALETLVRREGGSMRLTPLGRLAGARAALAI